MTTRSRLLLLSLVSTLLASCASGPKFAEAAGGFPAAAPGTGRLFVYRPSSLGAAIRPDVHVDGQVIGSAKGNGFLFADLAPGTHTVMTRTEVTKSTQVNVYPGQASYVRLRVAMGLLAARIIPEVAPPATAQQEIATCKWAR